MPLVQNQYRGHRMFVLPEERYPHLFEHLSVSEFNGGITEVPSYNIILTYVSLGLGIAVVPGWYEVIRSFNGTRPATKTIGYQPIRDVDKIRLCALRRLDGHRLKDECDQVVSIFDEETKKLHLPND